jgi:hypothetical protein
MVSAAVKRRKAGAPPRTARSRASGNCETMRLSALRLPHLRGAILLSVVVGKARAQGRVARTRRSLTCLLPLREKATPASRPARLDEGCAPCPHPILSQRCRGALSRRGRGHTSGTAHGRTLRLEIASNTRLRGAHKRAFSPCGRRPRRRSNRHDWMRGARRALTRSCHGAAEEPSPTRGEGTPRRRSWRDLYDLK